VLVDVEVDRDPDRVHARGHELLDAGFEIVGAVDVDLDERHRRRSGRGEMTAHRRGLRRTDDTGRLRPQDSEPAQIGNGLLEHAQDVRGRDPVAGAGQVRPRRVERRRESGGDRIRDGDVDDRNVAQRGLREDRGLRPHREDEVLPLLANPTQQRLGARRVGVGAPFDEFVWQRGRDEAVANAP
jgi:hypothetical protein